MGGLLQDRTHFPTDWMRFGALRLVCSRVAVCAKGERMETAMSDMEVVSAVQAALADRVGQERYECWFAHNTQLSLDGGKLWVRVASPFFQNWLQCQFRAALEAACQAVLGHVVPVEFVAHADGTARVPCEQQAAAPQPVLAAVAAMCPPSARALEERGSGERSHGGSQGGGKAGEAFTEAAMVPRVPAHGPHTAADQPLRRAAREGGGDDALPQSGGPGVRAAAREAPSAREQQGGQSAQPASASPARRRLASLDQFVTGPENTVAHAAALAAAKCPGRSSPLVFYGPTSVGKTHLLEGVLAAARMQRPTIRAVYLTAEQFTISFLDALHGSGLPSFRRKLRDLDMFLLDDLQFLARKRATLAEFVHTLDTLHRRGGQVVLATDRSPAELRVLGEDLVTRLQAGLCLPVGLPSDATRRQLVRNLAGRLGIQADEDVLQRVALRVPSHARALMGALRSLEITAQAEGRPITLELAERVLAEVVPPPARAIRLGDIEQAVCEVCGVTQAELHSDNRSRRVADPRALAMWLARKYTRAALAEIGQYFGRKSHTSVLGAKDKVENWLKHDAQMAISSGHCSIAEAIRRVEQRLLAG